MSGGLSIYSVLKKWIAAAHGKCKRLFELPRGFRLQTEGPALYSGHSVNRIWFARSRADQIQEGNPVRLSHRYHRSDIFSLFNRQESVIHRARETRSFPFG